MISSISCYVLIKDPFTTTLSNEQIKKAETKPCLNYDIGIKRKWNNEHSWKISLNQVFMIAAKSNTSKTEKLKSLIKRQKLKIIQELWAFS